MNNMIPSQKPLNRDSAVRILLEHKGEYAQFHICFLGLFGSVARNEANSDSDVDLLVNFDRPVGFFHLVRVQKFLENILQRKVDLVMEDILRKEFRDQVMKEIIRAA
jgi:predicted nucleotidyltransferase